MKENLLFECSWEVCNKVGGIYTVLMSKAARMLEQYGDNYFTVGPYFNKKNPSLEELDIPDFLKDAFDNLSKKNIHCHYGKWLI